MPEALDPLGDVADPRRYVALPTAERVLAALAERIEEGLSPILLTGPPGCGKTLLLRVLAERERLRGRRVAFSPFLHLPGDEVAPWLLHLLGCARPVPAVAPATLVQDVRRCARSTLVLVDEIQGAPEDAAARLAAIAAAARPALLVVAAGSEGPALAPVRAALAPASELSVGPSYPIVDLETLCDALLEQLPEHRLALPARERLLRSAEGLPGSLKAELARGVLAARPRSPSARRSTETVALDAPTPSAPGPVVAAPARPAEPVAVPAARIAPSPEIVRASAPRAVPTAPVARPTQPPAPAAHSSPQPTPNRVHSPRLRRAARARLHWVARAARHEIGARGLVLAASLFLLVAIGRLAASNEALRYDTASLFDAARARAARAAADTRASTAELASRRSRAAPIELLPVALTPSAASAAGAAGEPIAVQVNARPWANIRVDGRDVGPTPLGQLRLAPGTYEFEAAFPDGHRLRRSIEITPERRFIAMH